MLNRTVDAQTQKYQQVCKSKKQGDMVSFAYKGVVYITVTCEPNRSWKLAFQPPMPANNAILKLKAKFRETQSAPRPVSSVQTP